MHFPMLFNSDFYNQKFTLFTMFYKLKFYRYFCITKNMNYLYKMWIPRWEGKRTIGEYTSSDNEIIY